MTAMKSSKRIRTLGAVLAALFATFAAGCTEAGAGTGPAPNAPAPKGAPAPGVVVVAPMQTNA
jgi:hypothetical protein